MKKITISMLIVAASAGIFLSSISYVGRKKDKTLIPSISVKKAIFSDKLPEGFDSAYVEQLSKLGMNTTKEALLLKYTKQRKYYKEKFGLSFLGDVEMTTFLNDNNFILGESSRYLHMIPIKAGKVMIENINMINPYEEVYRFWVTLSSNSTRFLKREDLKIVPKEGESIDYWIHEEMTNVIKLSAIKKYNIPVTIHYNLRKDPPKVNQIFIIGSVKDFDTKGMVIEDRILKAEPPRDPIAVLKVTDGYVELANWE